MGRFYLEDEIECVAISWRFMAWGFLPSMNFEVGDTRGPSLPWLVATREMNDLLMFG